MLIGYRYLIDASMPCNYQYCPAFASATSALHPVNGWPPKPWPVASSYCSHMYPVLLYCCPAVPHAARSWEHFHKLLHLRLNSLLDVTQPRKTVMLAVDGPAPLAKLLTQRDRRKVRRGWGSAC